FGHTAGAPWRVVQRIEFPEPGAANAQALYDLENGATGLALLFAGAIGADGFGLGGDASLARGLGGVGFAAGFASGRRAGVNAADMAQQLTDLVRREGLSPNATDISFGFDPLGDIAVGTQSARSWRDDGAGFAVSIDGLASQGYKGPFAAADGRVVHNAGG